MYPVLLSGYSRKYCPNNPEYAPQIDVHYHEAEFQIANSNRESVLSSYNNLFKHILRIVNISANKNTGIRFDIKSLRQLKLISFESAYNSFL